MFFEGLQLLFKSFSSQSNIYENTVKKTEKMWLLNFDLENRICANTHYYIRNQRD